MKILKLGNVGWILKILEGKVSNNPNNRKNKDSNTKIVCTLRLPSLIEKCRNQPSMTKIKLSWLDRIPK